MMRNIHRFLLFMLFMVLCNAAFAKGVAEFCREIYRNNHSEEWIREAIQSNPNVKEIVKMIKATDSEYRMYILMKDETKIILSGIAIEYDDSITGSLERIGDYGDIRKLWYEDGLEKYELHRYKYSSNEKYFNEAYYEYINSRDIIFLLNNYREIKEFFASMPCLTNEDWNLLKEGRFNEIEALKHIDWEKLKEKKFNNDYIVLKAEDFLWTQWKVE